MGAFLKKVGVAWFPYESAFKNSADYYNGSIQKKSSDIKPALGWGAAGLVLGAAASLAFFPVAVAPLAGVVAGVASGVFDYVDRRFGRVAAAVAYGNEVRGRKATGYSKG